MENFKSGNWALILGGSSGFGLATAQKLAKHGMNIFIVHRDRRGAMHRIEKEFDLIKAEGVKFNSLNINALAEEGRAKALNTLQEVLADNGKVKLLLHSIAFGNLKPIAQAPTESSADIAVAKLAEKLGVTLDNLKAAVDELLDGGISPLHTLKAKKYGNLTLTEEDMEQTIYSMGSSLLSWVQALHKNQLFDSDARVIGLTSEGNEVAWRGYAAVAAAKVALESISRSIAVEFAPYGIRSNIIQPGVTPTPALKMIPGSKHMEAVAKLKNPFARTTTPDDVANFITLMCTKEAAWVNGSIIRVDGGEHISSL